MTVEVHMYEITETDSSEDLFRWLEELPGYDFESNLPLPFLAADLNVGDFVMVRNGEAKAFTPKRNVLALSKKREEQNLKLQVLSILPKEVLGYQNAVTSIYSWVKGDED